jgi:HEAT repeat protein
MSRGNFAVALATSAVALGLIVALLIIQSGRPARRDPLDGDLRDLAGRLDIIERSLDDRLERIEGELRSLPAGMGAPRQAAAPGGSATEAARAEGEGRSARDPGEIGSSLESLRLRIEALEADPIQRGYGFLQSESEELRREGIRSLRRLARFDPEARAAIRGLLADPSPRVRMEALDAVRDSRDREAIPAVAALLGDGEAMVRRESIEALAALGARESAPAIAALLNDGDPRVRERAADALGPLKAPEAIDALVAALRDPSGDVRGEAIASLGEIGARGTAPALRAMYDAGAGVHHMRLANSLRALGDPGPFQREVRLLSEQAVSDPDPAVRLHAVQDLGRYAPERSAAIFQKASQDPDPRVRREAERSLPRKK